MNDAPKREAAQVGRGRELALLVLCAVEGAPAAERADAARIAFESPSAGEDEGALAAIEALRKDGGARQSARRLVDAVLAGWEGLDASIEAASKTWRLERMHQVDRNLLRIACVELEQGRPEPAVVAAEATRLAGRYGAEHSARFVNGVVDTLAARSRASGARGDEA